MKRLVVIDGKSVFYRGYYAMGALSTSDGTPTGGVYGFAAIAMELVKKLNPDKVVVAWDKAKTSVSKRVAIYPEYKAGRVKPPEDFFVQIPYLRELIEALGWAFVECDDYEADDIIGTLAFQSREAGDYEVIIISSDLDMLQVVDQNVKMYRLLKGFSELEEIDVEAVEKKYGIRKEQFLDLKAIKGDASDNIPGVPGIGEKGAVKLLNEYGSLNEIYEHIEDISGAMKKKLIAGKDSAFMSYRLAKIMTDAPIKLEEIPELVVDTPRIIEALRKLEFKSLERKFLKAQKEAFYDQKQGSEEVLSAGESSEKNVGKLPEDTIFSFDIKELMHRNEIVARKILKGAKFYDLGQGRFLLNPLARKTDDNNETLFADDPEEMRQEYFRQQEEFKKLPKLKRVFTQLDMPLIPILYKIEKKGMKIDFEHFKKLEKDYETYVGRITNEIFELAGTDFNVNSTVQLSYILFTQLGLPTKGIKKTTRGYSTGAKELEKLRNLHPIIPKIIEYREAAKLLSTYILPLPQLADIEGRVHTTFTQDVTATGRLSSLNPNLQNIPTRTEEGKRIREGFVADPGKVLISADYAQFELRLAAALADDAELIDDFNAGTDIHKKTAAQVYKIPMEEVTAEQRRHAKVVNFGIIYGMSPKGLADATGMSFMEAKRFVDHYMELRKAIGDKMKGYLVQARNEGFVETYFGRRRPTPDVKSANFVVRMGAERAAQNMPIQGTEADLMKLAMILLDGKLPEGADMIMQVHDSIMVETTPDKAEEVKRIMKEVMEGVAPEFKVKLAVDVKEGLRWSEV
ncbi:hypothetical protein IJH46_00830 [Candidatus Saccharibacteria bacterium]|nr:hypothetical protein [Candidatus Saccharibacteria bacterium]